MEKNKILRLSLLKQRWMLSPSKKTKLDHIIYLRALQAIKLKSPKKYIALYWPIENEVDTIAIIHELLKQKHKVCIPYIRHNKMSFKPITSIHFKYEYWKNMRQPIIDSIVNNKGIEIMVIPMIGFDKSNHRMGYGFNHYNSYLHASQNIYTIGLAYDFQRNDEFITTSYDKMLDKIVTNR